MSSGRLPWCRDLLREGGVPCMVAVRLCPERGLVERLDHVQDVQPVFPGNGFNTAIVARSAEMQPVENGDGRRGSACFTSRDDRVAADQLIESKHRMTPRSDTSLHLSIQTLVLCYQVSARRCGAGWVISPNSEVGRMVGGRRLPRAHGGRFTREPRRITEGAATSWCVGPTAAAEPNNQAVAGGALTAGSSRLERAIKQVSLDAAAPPPVHRRGVGRANRSHFRIPCQEWKRLSSYP